MTVFDAGKPKPGYLLKKYSFLKIKNIHSKQIFIFQKTNVIMPVPDLGRAKIDAHSLYAVIVKEYSNGQFKLGT